MLVEVVLAGLLLLLLWQVLKKPSGLPPGLWGLPLVGYVPLSNNIEDTLMDLHKKHGDVYVWRMGTQLNVYLHNYQMAKELYSKMEYVERPEWIFFCIKESPPLGVAGTSGETWHRNRRFTLRHLRDLGMGKSTLVDAVQTQASILIQELKKQVNRPAPIPHALTVAIVNIIWKMVGDRSFAVDDPQMKEFQILIDEFIFASNRMLLLDYMPWIEKYFPSFVSRWIGKLDLVLHVKDKHIDYFTSVIDEHRAVLDRDDPKDLIDSYLIEMEDNKDNPSLNDKDLAVLVWDLFTAGSVTTVDTLVFIFQYLAVNPEIQRKMQAEIDRELGDQMATLANKVKMPYTEAVINEVLRMSSLTATGLQHVATVETKLNGYTIPKGSILNTVAFSMHYDPRYWDQPNKFYPERWLDDEGHLFTKKEGFMPFSVGKRQCLGEALARMELFIFTATLFQTFTFEQPPGKTINPRHDPDKPFFHSPVMQDIVIKLRK